MTKSVIETLQDHRTRRQFTTEPISDAQFAQIITTAQQMPTSQYLQAYSLIEIAPACTTATIGHDYDDANGW